MYVDKLSRFFSIMAFVRSVLNSIISCRTCNTGKQVLNLTDDNLKNEVPIAFLSFKTLFTIPAQTNHPVRLVVWITVILFISSPGHNFLPSFSICIIPKQVSRSWLLTGVLNLNKFSDNCFPWPKFVSWHRPKIISLRWRSHCTLTLYVCPGHNFSLPCLMWVIFRTIVVLCPWVFHDLESMSYLKYERDFYSDGYTILNF